MNVKYKLSLIKYIVNLGQRFVFMEWNHETINSFFSQTTELSYQGLLVFQQQRR